MKQISIERLEIWKLFTESLSALEKKFDSKLEETNKFLKQTGLLQEIQVSEKIRAEC
jgi:hypothetical protein